MLLTARFGEPTNTADTVFASILAVLVIFEFLADQQQWGMHPSLNSKYSYSLFYRLPKCKERIPNDRKSPA